MFSSKLADSIEPYVPGEQIQGAGIIKLNTNENPYPPTPAVDEALKSFDTGVLRLYNDPENTALRNKIAEFERVPAENIFVGNGSDEVLAMAFPAFATTGAAFSEITYSFYEVYCKLFSIKVNLLPMKPNLQQDVKSYYNTKGDMVVVCNPNAPTGQLFGEYEIEHILKANKDKVVLVDEAYSPFSSYSAIPFVGQYSNLLVVKTFSKAFSLAGIRCGYAIGERKLIDTLKKIKNSFNSYTVNALTERVAIAALNDADYTRATIKSIITTRRLTYKLLTDVGFNVMPSETNFVFATHKSKPASYIYEELKKRNILVRYFDKPKIDNYLRITIGTPEQMYALYSALKEIVS